MKLLWLCNMVPGAVRQKQGGRHTGGLWIEHVLSDLSAREDIEMLLLFPDRAAGSGSISQRVQYAAFEEKLPYRYQPELEIFFSEKLSSFRPDVIHIWGTEYGHTLAMVRACSAQGMADRMAVSIQGLCSVIARHYTEGLPEGVQRGFTFRDLLRWDNIRSQTHKFFLRGQLEKEALLGTQHILGRTEWDKACTAAINPQRQYHLCNETLREEFYTGQWSYGSCRKHRIFAAGCSYPVKGFHYLLEGFAQIVRDYPDATLAVPGESFLNPGVRGLLRRGSYQRYLARLARSLGVADKIEFLGKLDAQAMRREYLQANVFVLSSVIENSPNSLGEAMLLGVPAVAADVGGVSTLLRHETEGYLYQSSAPYMLAGFVEKIFAMEQSAEQMGSAARAHALITHDPAANLRDLLTVYEELAN